MSIEALKAGDTEKIVLCRPAIDSGASLGFLPGTMEEKIGPYLVPLFDELTYYVEPKAIKAWQDHRIIEVVPLSLMRGRTFNNAYVILDEAQNATMSEIRMFLTRIGINSRMILIGDLNQSDLPKDQRGAFKAVIQKLEGLDGVGICGLDADDIVRHHLIAQIEERLSR